jgi:hypothetical protein
MAAQRMEGHGLHLLLFLDDLHFFAFGTQFWVSTQDPPRIEIFGKSVVGTITKFEFFIAGTINSSPSPSVFKSALIMPFSLVIIGPAFLQLQFTQLYLWKLSV